MTRSKKYTGLEAVREITLHSLEAKDTLRLYEIVYASLNEMFSAEEANDLRRQFTENKIYIRELTNSAYKDVDISVPGFDAFVDIRYIDPRLIKYQTEVIIYNDTVAFYTYGDDAYGMEIIDANFAAMQKQIFDQVWRKASRPVIGRNGRSSLI
jgi:sugar-specific transcriptional regulator TrmB